MLDASFGQETKARSRTAFAFMKARACVVANSQDVASHHRTKHIAVRDMMITHHAREGTFDTQYVEGKHNPADILTKMVGKREFQKHAETLRGREEGHQYSLSRRTELMRG